MQELEQKAGVEGVKFSLLKKKKKKKTLPQFITGVFAFIAAMTVVSTQTL